MNTATSSELEYVGFWPRVGAALIDTAWALPVVSVLAGLIYANTDSALVDQMMRDPAHVSTSALAASLQSSARDLLVEELLLAVLILLWWFARNATPGKIVLRMRIVDARTGAAPSKLQLVIRYLGYFVSTIPFGLGLLAVGWDPRHQGWHDKLAGTVVVRPKQPRTAAVEFPGRGAK